MDDRGPRPVDPEAARRLRALFDTPLPPSYERPRALLAVLVLVPVLFVLSQPLPWHHDIIPGAPYQVIYGYTRNLWVLIVGAIAVGIAIRIALRPLTTYVVVLLIVLAGFTLIGLYGDWANAYSNAGAQNMRAYNGPGFFSALAAALGLVVATALAWRDRATSRAF
jgi:hypothetical protein